MMKLLLLIPLLLIGIIPVMGIIPSQFDYIITQNSTGVYAINGQTGTIDYSGTDAGTVITNAALKFYPSSASIFVTCGTWNLFSSIHTWSGTLLQGCGEGQTIFKRMFNGTNLHTMVFESAYNGNNGFAYLKDFTVDGNYPHTDNTQDEIAIAGNGQLDNIEVKNYNAIGEQLAGNIQVNNPKIIGVNSSTIGSTMGIWQPPNTRITINGGDIENNRLNAVFSSGDLRISGCPYFSHNHLQTNGGGGQLDLGSYAIIDCITIDKGNSVTSGIETNQGNYTITDSRITGEWYGIVSNGQTSNLIVSNNFLSGNQYEYGFNGNSVWHLSNNIP